MRNALSTLTGLSLVALITAAAAASNGTDTLPAGCGGELVASARRDWTTDPSLRWFPLSYRAKNAAGGIHDDTVLDGPPFRDARVFTSGYFVLVLDRDGKLLSNPKAKPGDKDGQAFDFETSWALASPNEPGDLTPFESKDHPSLVPAAASIGGVRRFFRSLLPARPAPPPPVGPDRFPVLGIDRAGGLEKDRRHFYFRYPIFRLGPTMTAADAQTFCRTLALRDRAGLVFRRPFTRDESAQVDHIVETAYAETQQIRSQPPVTESERVDYSRRQRELRAMRFLEIPPVTEPGLLVQGGEAPEIPESAMLVVRTSTLGLGQNGARYAYDLTKRELIEIARQKDTWFVRSLANRGAFRRITDDALQQLLPNLRFASSFLTHYLGE